MALGIFAGTGMDVKAAEPWSLGVYTQINSFDDLVEKCDPDIISSDVNPIISFIDRSMSEDSVWVVVMFYENNNVWMRIHGRNEENDYYFDTINITSSNYDTYKDSLSFLSQYHCCLYIQKDTTPSSSEGASNSEVSSTPHTHSYSWVTVQDVSSEQDGIEEYRCSCGNVQERCVIPRYMAIVKGLYGAVKDAPQNGTATFDTGSAFTMTDYVIRKLSERTDVTTVITFEYQSQAYKMTIPAGADFTGLLADEDYFYGYFFFANAVGATIEAL